MLSHKSEFRCLVLYTRSSRFIIIRCFCSLFETGGFVFPRRFFAYRLRMTKRTARNDCCLFFFISSPLSFRFRSTLFPQEESRSTFIIVRVFVVIAKALCSPQGESKNYGCVICLSLQKILPTCFQVGSVFMHFFTLSKELLSIMPLRLRSHIRSW